MLKTAFMLPNLEGLPAKGLYQDFLDIFRLQQVAFI